jgi:hypothetical protein
MSKNVCNVLIYGKEATTTAETRGSAIKHIQFTEGCAFARVIAQTPLYMS